MTWVYAKHEPYNDGRLADVIADMHKLGAPTIRVVRFDGNLIAIEGSHRLAAAQLLGIRPIFMDETELMQTGDVDSYWRRVLERLPLYDVTGSPLFDGFRFTSSEIRDAPPQAG